MSKNDLWLAVYVKAVVALTTAPESSPLGKEIEYAVKIADAALEAATEEGRVG